MAHVWNNHYQIRSKPISGPSWLWSYGSWIYNYPCNLCLSPLMLWVRILLRERCTTLCDKVCQFWPNILALIGFMVFNATFNNISVISLRSALSLEEIEVPGKKHRPAASHWQTVQHKCHTSRNREIINLYEKETAVIKLNLIQTMWTWWKKIQCFDTDIHCITQSSSVENSRWPLSILSGHTRFCYRKKKQVISQHTQNQTYDFP
jgi:hypothetical protein